MLSSDAFLRRLPVGLSPVQAIRIEALVYSADAIETSYGVLKGIASTQCENIITDDRSVRIQLFTNAWTIVDSVHAARQLLRALDYNTPRASEFQEKYEAASLLRNSMDHLKDQSQNLANKKRKPPLFGTLSYVYLTADTLIRGGWIEETHGGMISLSMGRIRGNVDLPLINPANISYDEAELRTDFDTFGASASGFRLDAFDKVLDLSSATSDIDALMAEFDQNASGAIPRQLQKYAADNGLNIDDLIGNEAAGFSAYVKF
jgi:hypothetical protein